MKVFFTGSPRALKTYKNEHEEIYRAIENNGGVNVSSLVIKADPKEFYAQEHKDVVDHYMDTMKSLKKADILIAEVSTHSMSMGFLVNKALEQGKMAIVLHLPSCKPFFLGGIENDKLRIYEYRVDTIDEIIKQAFAEYDRLVDTRFNFFISPDIARYLDWVHQNKKLPRAVFLRSLLEKAMKSDKDFEKR